MIYIQFNTPDGNGYNLKTGNMLEIVEVVQATDKDGSAVWDLVTARVITSPMVAVDQRKAIKRYCRCQWLGNG